MTERLDKLAELAAGVERPLVIVELGVATGKSLIAMAEAALAGHGADVYGVDLWDWATEHDLTRYRARRGFQGPGARAAFLRNLDASGLRATWIQGATHEVAKAWTRPIGLLYVDAAHDEASVAQDYDDWSPFIVPGGWIAFDDAQEGQKVSRVLEAHVKPAGEFDHWGSVEGGRLAFAQRKRPRGRPRKVEDAPGDD